MVLSKRLNHTAIKVTFTNGVEKMVEVSVSNRIEDVMNKYTHREIETNPFGVSILCLSGPKSTDASTSAPAPSSEKLYLGFLDKSRKVLRSLELEHFTLMREYSVQIEVYENKEIIKAFKTIPEVKNEFARVRLLKHILEKNK